MKALKNGKQFEEQIVTHGCYRKCKARKPKPAHLTGIVSPVHRAQTDQLSPILKVLVMIGVGLEGVLFGADEYLDSVG